MNIHQLPYIISIASNKSLSAAARQLGISQPALSKYLSGLEAEIGMELFFRYKKNLYPTPAGNIYLNAAKDILKTLEQMDKEFASLDEPVDGTFHFGTSPHRGAQLIIKHFPMFNNRFPQMEMIVHEHYAPELKRLLLEQKINLALTTSNAKLPDGLEEIPLCQEEIVMAVPVFHHRAPTQSFVLEELPYVELSDFQDSIFIMPSNETGLYDVLNPLMQDAGFSPKVLFSSPNIMTEIAMICAGRGVGMVPAYHVHPKNDGLAFGRLHHPPLMIISIITRERHRFTEEERYWLYLIIKYLVQIEHMKINWNSFLAGLVWKFDPALACLLHLEEWK